MAKSKGLKTLIRLSKFDLDEKRRALGELQRREDELIQAIRDAEAQLVREQEVAASDATGAGFIYGAYAQAWLDNRDAMIGRLVLLRQEIDRAQLELAEAFRQLKTYEMTQAAREKREREEADRKEQERLDDIGIEIYRRREQPED